MAAERIRLRLPGIVVETATDLDRALAEADIVSTATRSTEPLVKGNILRPGTHVDAVGGYRPRSEEHTSELQSLMRISYAVFCLKKKNITKTLKSNHYQ